MEYLNSDRSRLEVPQGKQCTFATNTSLTIKKLIIEGTMKVQNKELRLSFEEMNIGEKGYLEIGTKDSPILD